jgi:hypothetical protein
MGARFRSLSIAVGLMAPAVVLAQDTGISLADSVAESAPALVIPPLTLASLPLPELAESEPAGWPARRAARENVSAVGMAPIDERRKPFIATGALVGTVAGVAYAIHEGRSSPAGYIAAFLAAPVAMAAGFFAGGATGYVVSLVVYPPGR